MAWHRYYHGKILLANKQPRVSFVKYLGHLLVVLMQLVMLTVEIPTMHPVRWLCTTPIPEWAQ